MTTLAKLAGGLFCGAVYLGSVTAVEFRLWAFVCVFYAGWWAVRGLR